MIGKFWSIILEYFSAKMGIYLRCTAKDVLLCKRLGLSKSYTVFGLKKLRYKSPDPKSRKDIG